MENVESSPTGDLQDDYARDREHLRPADFLDRVIEAYKQEIDFTLVERNLKMTTDQRAQQLMNAVEFIRKFRPLAAASQNQPKKGDLR